MEEPNKEVEIIKEPRCSCEISINAKGLYSGKVKAYDFHLTEARSTATAEASALEAHIRAKNSGLPEKKED